MKRHASLGLIALTFFTLTSTVASCSAHPAASTSGAHPLKVFATTGYLADAVRNIAPKADVTTMVGPGGDPHTYQPTTQDMEAMRDSDLVLWNGLNLEAQMIDQLQSLGDKQLGVGEKLDKQDLLPWPGQGSQGEKLYDPHIWNSPKLWSQVVDEVGEKLGDIDKRHATAYEEATNEYEAKIARAHHDAAAALRDAQPRVLVTGHDAFNYFGKTFNFGVHATDFVTTEAALSPTEISDLADTIADKKVPVIFQDNQANPQAITSLKEAVHSRGWDVEVSDQELFADTLGPTAPTDTYLGVFSHNAHAVAEAMT